jgi:hypothetical protein
MQEMLRTEEKRRVCNFSRKTGMENYIEEVLRERGCEAVLWSQLPQDRAQSRDVMSNVRALRFHKNGTFLE